ncbi:MULTISPECIES: DUF6407 family protein [Bacillaceae]|jgi:hypothetical protein|uniref:DUF6407 family protein n=1 Tax=Metabacillus herbersteinensis TaxID=283816 RepID=A0ABV6GK96_9BACI|nr:DUF6407 family protein [Cytobacillus oceanisediminis]MCM3405379.1 DUF6407 family protein [Cytobacillus oceanisediminis]
MDSNLTDFVIETIEDISMFDYKDLECIKRVIRKAIDVYNLKSYEELEETQSGVIRFLYIHSMMEENILSKIVEITRNSEIELDIEGVYEGHVIRDY